MRIKQKRVGNRQKILLVLVIVFLLIFLILVGTLKATSHDYKKEICDGKDNDGDGIVDEGEKIFSLDLESPPNGPSISGLGWTSECKESCSPYCTKTTKKWHDGEVQPGHFFDSPIEGNVIAELTLRAVGFSGESHRPGQDNEVVEATINSVVFDRTKDNCNSLECQCTIEEQTSSKKVALTYKDNYITVREVDDSIGMKSAKAVFYHDLCEEVNHAPEITSSPKTETKELEDYSYQVVATDEDNDVLVYSLIQKPEFLEINSITGLITGVAPKVDKDTDFYVVVSVSDGKDLDKQEYTLTVKNVVKKNLIEIISPEENEIFNESQKIPIKVKIEDLFEIVKLQYKIFSLETNYFSGVLEDLEFNNTNGLHEKEFNTSENNLSLSAEHLLEVFVENKFGEESKEKVKFCIDFDFPENVGNFKIEVKNNDNAALNWSVPNDKPSCSGIAHYKIFRNSTFLTTVNNTTFLDENLKEGKYEYKVVAVDLAGHQNSGVNATIEIKKKSGGGSGSNILLECENWSVCKNSQQTRECVDAFTQEKRIETRVCVVEFTPLKEEGQNITLQQVKGDDGQGFFETGFGLVILIFLILIIILVFIIIITALTR